MNRVTTIFISLALCFSTLTIQAATQSEIDEAIALLRSSSSDLVESFTDEEALEILQSEGYGSVEIIKPGKIRFKVEGKISVLNLYEDGDMRMYFGSTGVELSYKAINEWNRTTRLSRAYLDSDRDIALETDLLATAGINKEMVLAMVKTFVNTSVPRFIKFAKENDQS